MNVNNEVFIALVFEKEPLWNKRDPSYKNKLIVDKCWKDLSAEMNQDEYNLRRRWRYMKNKFAVELGKNLPLKN